jgi:hypothetical protein
MPDSRISRLQPNPPARDWRAGAEAAALLAACAARPPALAVFAYRWGDCETRFVGRRVRRLRSLYRQAEPPADTPAWRAWLENDEQVAIRDTIAAARQRAAA